MGWSTQDNNDDAKVQVSGDYNKSGDERTDFLIIDKATGEHNHISIGTGANDGIVEHHDYK
jgi:hypothetical protein